MPHVPLSAYQYYNDELNMTIFFANNWAFYKLKRNVFLCEVSTIEIIGTNVKYFPRIFETSGLNQINVAWMKQKRIVYQKVAHSLCLLSNIVKETIARLTFIWLSRLSSFAHFMPCTLKPQMMLLLLSRIMSISVNWVKV